VLRLSQEQLPQESGVSARTIRRFETGEGAAWHLMTAYRLRKALEAYGLIFGPDGCSMSWPRELMGGQ
jgi:transcriptional regulator with XRE-family HTH domain